MTTMDQLKNNRDRYRRLEEIAGDPDITAEAKARRIRPVYEEAKAAESRLLAEVRDELKFRVRSAERKAFALPNLFGADPAFAQMNARDAFDRASRTNDQKELEATLERADLLGDNTLMRAVAWRANCGPRASLGATSTPTRVPERHTRLGPRHTASRRGSSPTAPSSASATPTSRSRLSCRPVASPPPRPARHRIANRLAAGVGIGKDP
jgi:hypothetical protein